MILFEHITRRFGAATALDDVSLEIRSGAVLGLLGENGAGKTTLMNVLYGLVRADAGTMTVAGRPYTPRSPREALARGVGMVHQHFMLVPTLTVAENVVLGLPGRRWLSPRRIGDDVARFAERISLPVEPNAVVSSLAVGQRQRIEILKALYRGVRVLILDEPTAVLTPSECDQLFAAVHGLREQGVTVVFISHKLREIVGHCDDVAILRRGRLVHAGPACGATEAQLAEWMVGESVTRTPRRVISTGSTPQQPPATLAVRDPSGWSGHPARSGDEQAARDAGAADSNPQMPRASQGQHDRPDPAVECARAPRAAGLAGPDGRSMAPALEIRDLSTSTGEAACRGARRPLLDRVNLTVAGGEIVGLAGVDGNGQDALVDTLVGVRRATSGSVLIAGRDVTRLAISARIAAGVAHISGDRQRDGLVMDFDLVENVALKRVASRPLSAAGWFRRRRADADARRLIAEFDVRTPSPRVAVRTLSGGNQQKLVAARELGGSPTVVIAVNPTRGVDVAATAYIRERLSRAAADGAGVLLVSSDLDEIVEMSDRIAVIFGGRVRISDWPRGGVEQVGRLMAGVV